MFTGISCTKYQDRFGFGGVLGGPDAQNTIAVRKEIEATILPRHLNFFEAALTRGGTQWMAGTDKPTIADFSLAPRLRALDNFVDHCRPEIATHYPRLAKYIDDFFKLSQVVAWYGAQQSKQ
mmetsp:Transcript_45734/g.107890  ORF Transcript_45734/g.107890 Transcript_45734/m.107890 type:complete len:122 (-) Transcript_45734:24-389(-)